MAYNILRPKRAVVLCFVLLILATVTYIRRDARTIALPKYGAFDVVAARSRLRNPVFADWLASNDDYLSLDLDARCRHYFRALDPKANNKDPGGDLVHLQYHETFSYTNVVYKKKRWISERRITLRRELRNQGYKGKLTAEHEQLILKQFDVASKLLSEYEFQVMKEVDHLKVFGQCFLNNNVSLLNEQMCSLFERKLYPWLSGKFPRFEDWEGNLLPENTIPGQGTSQNPSQAPTACFLDSVKTMSNGKGIVIPVFPHGAKSQIDHIIRLVRTLRALKNELPVQIVYMGQDLNLVNRKRLVEAARSEISSYPESYSAFHRLRFKTSVVPKFTSATDYPKQNIWFVDMLPVKSKLLHSPGAETSASFVLLLATIFNSFEEFLLLTSDAIPLMEKFDRFLFKQQTYREKGIKLFKLPSHLQLKKRKFEPGYHELSNLIKAHLMPSNDDARFFGLNKRKGNSHNTNRFLDEGFMSLIDPTMLVINKPKVLSGLLLSCSLQYYKILTSRLDVPGKKLNGEYIWLGQEISGVSSTVNFNHNFGVVAGVTTPPETVPDTLVTYSQEMCSASWGQLDDTDDYSLIYVTSHQLEKWFTNGKTFEEALKQKYPTASEGLASGTQAASETSAVAENARIRPLNIEAILNPPVVKKLVPSDDEKEPKQAWVPTEAFGGNGPTWWCAYSIVGGVNSGYLGKFIHFNDIVKAKYRFIIDVWLM